MKTQVVSLSLRGIMAVGLLSSGLAAAKDPNPPILAKGERILFLGSGFVENDQANAYLESRLQRRLPDGAISFRYMGWSGDTVRASARTAGFQVPQGLARLEKETLLQKPTLIFLAYGMNESFEDSRDLAGFLRDYDQLLKAIEPLKSRVVLLSPTYHEDLGRPYPEPSDHNRRLEEMTRALKEFSEKRKVRFIDLFHPLQSASKANPKQALTTNGILLTRVGYALAAKETEEQLGFTPYRWELKVTRAGNVEASTGTTIAAIRAEKGAIRFEATDAMLPMALDVCRLQVTGLLPGDYTLRIDGQDLPTADAADWDRGIAIDGAPMFAAAEKLREGIVLRNQLFYRRWRPYNDHSRHWGFIGGDYQLYDQEIAVQEKTIASLCRPAMRTFEIAPKKR